MSYIVKKTTGPVALDADFENGDQWKDANLIDVSIRMYPKYNIFKKLWRKWTGIEEREKNDPFQPVTKLKLMYDDNFIYGLFQVKDQYVRAVSTKYGQQACTDSCVEFFIRPANNKRYYNFEMTAGGFLLLYNITHLRRGLFTRIEKAECDRIKIYHSLPSVIDPEITEPVTWNLGFAIPIEFFVKYGDNVSSDLHGQIWTANAYKCADETSHPQWYVWQPLPKLDFHQPDCFAKIIFE